jgi:hypothetical protein
VEQTSERKPWPLAQVLRSEHTKSALPSAEGADQNSPAAIKNYAAWGWFSQIACLMMEESTLVVDSTRFDIVEIEAYLWREGHKDPYVHRDPQQTNTCGAWYFHREKAARLGFTLKGVDLTFGEPKTAAGGLLIRAVMNQATGEFIEGPSKVVDVILRTASVTCVAELKQKISGLQMFKNDAFDAAGILHIEPRAARGPVPRIMAGPRIGLGEKDAYFRHAPYRFHARPELAKKEKASLVFGLRPGAGTSVSEPQAPKPDAWNADCACDEAQLIEAYLDELLG